MGCSRSTDGGDDWDEEAEAALPAALEERIHNLHLPEGSMTIEEAFGIDPSAHDASRRTDLSDGEPRGRGRLKPFLCERQHSS
jgi:hypothetical protein